MCVKCTHALPALPSALQQSLLAPMATRVEEWKKTEYTIEKEHDRGGTHILHIALAHGHCQL